LKLEMPNLKVPRIDLVPEDYIQRKELHRANFFYLGLLAVMAIAMLGTFAIIKVRQKAVRKEAKAVDERMAIVEQSIKQLEDLRNRREEMLKTALLSAELIEPVPRSLVIAFLTNALPEGVSLTRIQIAQKEQQAPKGSNQYKAAKKSAQSKQNVQEFITELQIEGLAVSDIGVADYIASLSKIKLLENVCLVHSMQKEIDSTTYRRFKLTAQLGKNLIITGKDVDTIANFKPVPMASSIEQAGTEKAEGGI
jgi:hypothetical protein